MRLRFALVAGLLALATSLFAGGAALAQVERAELRIDGMT